MIKAYLRQMVLKPRTREIYLRKYRVTCQVGDYILLTLIWEFHHAMPILPDLQLPK